MKSLEQKRRPLPLPAELEAQHEHARSEKAQDRIEHSQGFYPATVAHQLKAWKREQEHAKETLGGEYTDYNLILANGLGHPMERTRITALLNAWKSP